MKKINPSTRISTLALAFSVLAAGPAQAEWIKSYGTKNSEYGSVMPTSQDNYYLSMLSAASSANAKPATLFSLLNANGVPTWAKKITTGAYDSFFLSELGNGRILLQGTTQTTATGPGDAVWAVYNVNRTTGALSPVFKKTYTGKGDDLLGITEGSSGVLWGTGSTTSFSQDGKGTDMIVAKINASTGAPDWSKVYHYDYKDSITAFIPKGNQFILLANAQSANSGSQKILIGLLNNLGVPVAGSFKKYGGNGLNTAVNIKAISGGNYLVYGRNQASLTDSNSTVFVMKLNANLGYVWGKQYAAGSDQGLDIHSINENANGSLTFTGSLKTTIYFDQGGFHIPLYTELHPAAIELSSAGAVTSGKSFEHQEMDSAQFDKNADGSYLLGGQTMAFDLSNPNGNVDALYGQFNASIAPSWVKTLAGAKVDIGFIKPRSVGYSLSGATNSWGAGNMDVLLGRLDANGDVPGCAFINDIAMTETTPTISASDLNWQAQAAALVKKGAITQADININVTKATITATTVCNH
ncbi:MAG: hypothetical protein Q7U57_05360 [Methylovulum sp.]|nr:hypothetical protein [Methylovulum sp.]